MMVETLANTYTTEEEIVNVLSQAGIDFDLDDLSAPLRTQAVKEFIEDATDIINQHAAIRYEETDLANSRWVHSRASWIAAWLFSQRRGNPAPDSLANRYEIILDELREVRNDNLDIPRLATKSNFVPSISNFKIDDRFGVRKIRVQTQISSGGTYSEQDIDTLNNLDNDWF